MNSDQTEAAVQKWKSNKVLERDRRAEDFRFVSEMSPQILQEIINIVIDCHKLSQIVQKMSTSIRIIENFAQKLNFQKLPEIVKNVNILKNYPFLPNSKRGKNYFSAFCELE